MDRARPNPVPFAATLVSLGLGELVTSALDGLEFQLGPDDAKPFPFSDCAPYGASVERQRLESFGCGCGPDARRSAEYVAALAELDTLVELARTCGDEARVAADLIRRKVTALLNAGVELYSDGERSWFDCPPREVLEVRPTRGQVRLALAAFAAEVGRLCHGAQAGAAVKPEADTRPASAPSWFIPVLVGSALLLLLYHVRWQA